MMAVGRVAGTAEERRCDHEQRGKWRVGGATTPRRSGAAASGPGRSRPAGRPGRRGAPRGGRRGDGRDGRPPWRGEGARTPDGERPAPPQWSRIFRRLWWVILIVLVVNWLFASAMLGPKRTTVSYTFFRQQVQAGNVKEITSTGDSIQGDFRTAPAY